MDQSTCCLWSVEINEASWCCCKDCLVGDLRQLPFSEALPCPYENHMEDLVDMLRACEKASSAILRLISVAVTQPERVSLKLIPRIIRRQILLASLSVYDAKFMSYLGPVHCTCEALYPAMLAVKKLHDVCIATGHDTHLIWSFLPYVPTPIHSVIY